MKKNYKEPITKIVLRKEDVITTSVMGDDNVVGWPGQPKEVDVWN